MHEIANVISEVFEAEFDYVWRSLIRMGITSADAEDLAQEVFCVLADRIDELSREQSIRPWLFVVAANLAKNFKRKHKRVVRIEPPDRAGGPRPDEEHAAACLAHRLLLKLPPERRAVVILYDLDGIPMPEVAAALEIPLDTAYSRLRRARQELLSALREVEEEEAAQ